MIASWSVFSDVLGICLTCYCSGFLWMDRRTDLGDVAGGIDGAVAFLSRVGLRLFVSSRDALVCRSQLN